ncbi:MAG: hypothetical protein ABII01_06360, partial [Candidatus Woesearchaeota archaeon]
MKKKGIELSVNFMVTLIIIIIIFGLSIVIVRKFFLEAYRIQDELDKKTLERINTLLNRGEVVVVWERQATIPVKESEIFGIGVLNLGNDGEDIFHLNIRAQKGYNEDGNPICQDPDLYAMSFIPNCNDYFTIDYDRSDWSIA